MVLAKLKRLKRGQNNEDFEQRFFEVTCEGSRVGSGHSRSDLLKTSGGNILAMQRKENIWTVTQRPREKTELKTTIMNSLLKWLGSDRYRKPLKWDRTLSRILGRYPFHMWQESPISHKIFCLSCTRFLQNRFTVERWRVDIKSIGEAWRQSVRTASYDRLT